ncbi:MAG: hypothetical protein Q9167_006992 [Letrouitia subvulpina]
MVISNNINGWTGCSGDQKNIVTQAYKDALRLGDYVDPYRGHDELFAPTSPNQTVDSSKLPDALSIRFFGQQTSAGSSQAAYVGGVLHRIGQWYPWPIFDWIWGKRIEVRCTDVENKCQSVNGQQVAAYASNTDQGPKITFCGPFWQYSNLDDKKTQLDGTPNWQKDIGSFKTQGQIFLHEMTHLLVISNDKKSTLGFFNFPLMTLRPRLDVRSSDLMLESIVIDFKWPEGSARAYGPKLCEKLAKQSDQKNTWDAILNADNYGKSIFLISHFLLPAISSTKSWKSSSAHDLIISTAMYTAGSWFAQFYGLPSSRFSSYTDEDNYNPSNDIQSSNLDGSPDIVDAPIDEGSFTVNSAYPASTGYDADTAQVSDMISWASTALKNPHDPASTTITTLMTSAPPIPSSVPAAPSKTSPAAPPTCTQK